MGCSGVRPRCSSSPSTSACLLTAPEPHARSTTDEGALRRWDLMAIGAPAAWARGAAGQGQLIAIVDSGIDLDHPDLAAPRPGGRRLHRHGRRSGALPRHRRRRRRPRHPRGRHRRGDRPRGRAPRDPGPRRGLRGRALPGRGHAPATWPPASSGPPPHGADVINLSVDTVDGSLAGPRVARRRGRRVGRRGGRRGRRGQPLGGRHRGAAEPRRHRHRSLGRARRLRPQRGALAVEPRRARRVVRRRSGVRATTTGPGCGPPGSVVGTAA